jgi:hypothetical protein
MAIDERAKGGADTNKEKDLAHLAYISSAITTV